ncbi:hypothetical protein BBJ28_00010072 [Nothophytophthora sp. Chile5]|nr:hypothetical protein BBJ28_00010072 [Nothophytophthora sp. Chile5]
MSSSNNDDDFVTKTTKHRKKMTAVGSSGDQQAAKKPPVATNGDGGGASAGGASAISLRPRTMFAMKGRGRTESEGSAYRPQWSKDGEGFVSATGAPASFKDAATGGGDAAGEHRGKDGGERRKSKVLRYTKEELLALHFTTSEPPEFPPETMVASEHALPPVGTLPFDYEEIYKQWSLNRNRGRGRGRGAAPPGGLQGTRGHSDRARGDGKWEEGDGAKHRGDDHREGERDSTWQRGARVTENSRDGGDVWDDVLEAGTDSNEMVRRLWMVSAEKFRREMDAMRDELQGSSIDPGIKDDLDAFDKKLEDAAAAGQFDDSDNEETQWDDALEPSGAGGSLEPQNPAATRLSGQTNSGGLFDALEPAGAQFALEEKSSFSLPQLPVDDHLSGMPSMHAEVEDEWFYLDPQGLQQGPFKTAEMREWFEAGYFKPHLPIRFGREGGLDPARPSSPIAPETAQLPTPTNANPPVVDAWGVRPTSPADTSLSLHEIQNQEKRRAVENVRSSLGGSDDQTSQPQALDGSGGVQQQRHNESSPVKATKKEQTTGQGKEKKTSPNVAKKNGKNGESTKREANAWTDGAAASAPKASNNKSLKSIQHEEQREMRNKMAGDASGTANLAQMGAQLKMMLGVESTAVAPGSSPAPAAKPVPAPKPMPSSMPAPPAAPVASPWGTPAVASQADLAKKQSLRDILAEEERLAHERAKANEAAAASSSSHWMNIVAGNTVASAAIPKPSRSSLGPVPASVLKSRQQIRANGAKASPAKVESDASFWNFGAAAQSVNKESVTASSANAFGSSSVSSEFMAWASKQLSAIDANANVTLLEYCASVEDPGEIREYLAAYLGSTPRVSAFATEFIQRKKAQNGGKKSPGRQDADQRAAETGSSNKRGKRRPKNQKIDPSLLSYSVGS